MMCGPGVGIIVLKEAPHLKRSLWCMMKNPNSLHWQADLNMAKAHTFLTNIILACHLMYFYISATEFMCHFDTLWLACNKRNCPNPRWLFDLVRDCNGIRCGAVVKWTHRHRLWAPLKNDDPTKDQHFNSLISMILLTCRQGNSIFLNFLFLIHWICSSRQKVEQIHQLIWMIWHLDKVTLQPSPKESVIFYEMQMW